VLNTGPKIPALPPDDIGDYRISRALTPDQTYLALAPGDRQVIVKIMTDDCLLRGQLHPSIRDRLARVRELAHRNVANLFGVERAAGKVFAVWEYIPGKPVNEHISSLHSPTALTALSREIILTVEALHALGIVHGRLRAGNVIVDDLSQIRLTHISPLLYDDPSNDLRDLIALIREFFTQRGWADLPAIAALPEAKSLAQLRMKLTSAAEPKASAILHPKRDRSPRRRALLAALIAAVAGVVIAAAVMQGVRKVSLGKPVPPEAPGQAMEAAARK
jgi:serine/threonine protein kinase